MNDIFKHRCRRRLTETRVPGEEAMGGEPFGAGSGGGPGDGDHTKYYDGWHKSISGQIGLWAEGTTGAGNALSPLIYLMSGMPGSPDGQINAHATQGIRLTVGSEPGEPSSSTYEFQAGGVEIQTSDTQTIHLLRGMDENPMQGRIAFNLDGIGINGNGGGVWVKSEQMIKLSVAGGTSSIMLTPAGIIMQGPIIQIN